MPRTESTHTAQIIIAPGDLPPNTIAGVFAATTTIAATYVAEWDVYPPEPENGYPNGYRVHHSCDLRSIEVTIEIQGVQYTHPCEIKDLHDDVLSQIIDDCCTHALETQHER